MNYNCRVEIERINGKFIVQMEMSNYGAAKRIREVRETLEDAMATVLSFREEALKLMFPFADQTPQPTSARPSIAENQEDNALERPTRAKLSQPEVVEAQETLNQEAAEAVESITEAVTKNKGGRPKGSKNKPKVANDAAAAA